MKHDILQVQGVNIIAVEEVTVGEVSFEIAFEDAEKGKWHILELVAVEECERLCSESFDI